MAAELLPARPYPPWNRYVVLPVCKLLCRILFWVLGPIASRGAYRVPREGAVLIMSNHLADVDPIVVQVACPRAVHFMAKSELFEMRFIGRMIRWFQAFPVKRGEPDRASMRHAIDLLKKGEAVALFPEGQLSEDGVLQELKAGVALIVRQAAATGEAQAPASGARTIAARGGGLKVICCGVRNSNRVMPYGRMVPRISGHRVWVEWGEVRAFTRDSSTEEILGWATAQLKDLSADPNRNS